MATAKELVTWAASQIGTKESPAGSNKVKYWDFYKSCCGANYQGQPWCAAFVTNGMAKVGAWAFAKDEGRFRYCPSLVNWAKKNGQWLDRKEKPKAGDLIVFANRGTACHVGIVEKRIDSSRVQTIEGNTSVKSNDNGGCVMRRTRTYGAVGSKWYILGFVRTNWGGAEPKPAAVETKPKASSADTGLRTGTYTITTPGGLNVRTGPSTKYVKKRYSQLTKNAKQHATGTGVLKKGTRMSVVEIAVEKGSSRVWGKIPSGWVCLKENGKMYAKKS